MIARRETDVTSVAEETLAPQRTSGTSAPLKLMTAEMLKKRFRMNEFFAEKLITAIAFTALAAIVLIFVFVFREAAPILLNNDENLGTTAPMVEEETYGEEHLGEGVRQLEERDRAIAGRATETVSGKATLDNLLSTTWQPVGSSPKYGIIPLVIGSLKVTITALAVGAPLAIFAALFTSAFAPRWLRELIKPTIELLAGFPSVVIGFFALVVMATFMQQTFGYIYRLNAFVGGVAMALAVIPIIYTVAEDALNAVPKFMKEASLALGASHWQTALFVTLPAATPGVFAALLLGFGRAFGETMIVLMATGNAALMSFDIFEPVRTMSATIGAEMAEVVFGETHYHVLFLLGAILFVFTFTLNAFAEVYVRQRLLKRFRGEP